MNKWLVGLVLAAVVLPLLVFVGNLKVDVSQGDTSSGTEVATAAAAAEKSAAREGISDKFPEAPELVGISDWINSGPLTIAELRGKVVLVDFWTYTCINCIRTLPYLSMWNDKYSDKGLTIIGVHSPEFDFEKDLDNVKKAVTKYGIKYAVALDNEHETWRAFRNNYWPHKYLIDLEGRIRYDHIGEGGYDETEKVVQQLLKERAKAMNEKIEVKEETASPENAVGVDFSSIATPEIYLGYQFARVNLGNDEGFQPEQTVGYVAPSDYGSLVPNSVYLGGRWKNTPDSMELVSDEGRITLKYTAKAVNIVAGPGQQPALVQVMLNGNFVNSTNSGSDVKKSLATVDGQRLYNLVMDDGYHTKVVEVNVKGKGFRLYTFTFG
ncbi:thioredoxin family protein [Candidatus Woesearchaeota archaeon]|nr:thioredoxin family protein [Candidatus Woesearchaeota archaeon]